MSTQHYYGTKPSFGGYVGRVYHFDTTGDKEIEVYRSGVYDSKPEAVDDAAEWLDDNDIEALSDGTW